MKKQNGITLIALIITIIVMLILVAVTISVALNGGIFNNANEAKTQTNLAKEKEILQTTALGYLDDNGYVELATFATKENNLEGYTLTPSTNYVTASNGTNTFYITKQGGITEIEPQGSTEDLIPTDAEKGLADTISDGSYIYNYVGGSQTNQSIIIYMEIGNAKAIQMEYYDSNNNRNLYLWFCNEEALNLFPYENTEINKWYIFDGNNNQLVSYTTGALNNLFTQQELQNSYLNRINNSL